MTNGNNTVATINTQPWTDAASALSHNSKTSNPRAGPDSKPRPKLKLDASLKSIQETNKLQPTVIQVTLSNTTVTMLLVTGKLREK